MKGSLLLQKSRNMWLKEGDANTSYFHACINNRRKRNQIQGVWIEGVWCAEEKEISEGVTNYFKSLFHCDQRSNPTIDGVDFSTLSESQIFELDVAFSEEELKDAIKNPSKIQDFRPITLVGSLYKIIAKILAGRLKKVVSSLISASQSAFLQDRNILATTVVINEVIHSAKKDMGGCLLFKVGFEKAYDSGDPMTPFLFLLVAESFAGLVRKARSSGLFEGYKVGRFGVEITDLQFVDDTILVCTLKENNIWCVKSILRCFEMISGLKVNFNKSSLIGINVAHYLLSAAATFLSCKIGSIPFLYLGIPVGANPSRYSTWQNVIEKVASRLAGWKCKHISFDRRVVLINSMLTNMHIYMLSLLKAPKKVNTIPSTSRWWRDLQKLTDTFPRLHMLALEKDAKVADCGAWTNEEWSWHIHSRRRLFDWEEDLVRSLYVLIRNHSCTVGVGHQWRWNLDKSGFYVVRTAYLAQLNLAAMEPVCRIRLWKHFRFMILSVKLVKGNFMENVVVFCYVVHLEYEE
ncbi:PREDICTED: uncharacterized protein LOC109350582 [Lupinus angustifolius]|uniref:uncharacterized protein LOC109350582 n=1 Tax=Lupinus angustifolius TaxID=3871 RepID=UPI00092FC3C2|nr:PREDICTED: uncharacterized protein LOC109350582 [Lupinus angustifolius]